MLLCATDTKTNINFDLGVTQTDASPSRTTSKRQRWKSAQETTSWASSQAQAGVPVHVHTLKSTALALCYSTAECASPVWERSSHAKKMYPAVNVTCRLVTGCLRATPVEHLYTLAGIAPPDVRRKVASMLKERQRQTTDKRHPMFYQGVHPVDDQNMPNAN